MGAPDMVVSVSPESAWWYHAGSEPLPLRFPEDDDDDDDEDDDDEDDDLKRERPWEI